MLGNSELLHLGDSSVLNLTHPLGGHPNLLANLVVGVFLVVANTEGHLNDGLLSLGKDGHKGSADRRRVFLVNLGLVLILNGSPLREIGGVLEGPGILVIKTCVDGGRGDVKQVGLILDFQTILLLQNSGDFVHVRVTVVLGEELGLNLGQLVDRLGVVGLADEQVFVVEIGVDFPSDVPDCMGQETIALGLVEGVKGLNETDVAFIYEVQYIVIIAVTFGNGIDEPLVVRDKLILGFLVARMHLVNEVSLLRCGENLVLVDFFQIGADGVVGVDVAGFLIL